MWYLSVALVLAAMVATTCVHASEVVREGKSWDFSHGALRVDDSQRGLVHADGTPFIWLGDTAWELFHRLNRAEVEQYLEKRRTQGFTVIQAVALSERDGLNTPNAQGDRPLINNDPANPWTTPGNDPNDSAQYDYWDHVDYVFDTAATKGIAIGMLPTWGDKVQNSSGSGNGPQVLTTGNSRAYGRWLAQRYSGYANLIWILGGDCSGSNTESTWREMAAGIEEIDAGRHLITYHPWGGATSRQWFANDSWHAFSMIQTGHYKDTDVWNRISADWNASPTKPVLDAEPTYEEHPFAWDPNQGYATDYDTRKYTYWSLLSGAFGHTYGCHPVWQMYDAGREPVSSPRKFWHQCLDLDGAWDIANTRRLLEARPFSVRQPDQAMIIGDARSGGERLAAARASDNSYAMIYSAAGREFTADLVRLQCAQVRAWWFDPRAGTARDAGSYSRPADGGFTATFIPPSVDLDWLLVLDDAARGFAAPGPVTDPAVAEDPAIPVIPEGGDHRFINLNGSGGTIAGEAWIAEAQATGLTFSGTILRSTTTVTPRVAVDAYTSAMLNSGIWSQNDLILRQEIDSGTYDVYVWVMENYSGWANQRRFHLDLEGERAASDLGRMEVGDWRRYGPYRVSVSDAALDLRLVKEVGDTFLMGLEIRPVAPLVHGVKIRNASFEDDGTFMQNPGGWNTWTDTESYDADYAESHGGSPAGVFHMTHWNNQAYRVYTYQTVTGIANGTYTLSVWTKRSGAQQECLLAAKLYGDVDRFESIPETLGDTWTQVTIPGLVITNGQCEIGVWSDAHPGEWVAFDKVELFHEPVMMNPNGQIRAPTLSTTSG